MCCKRHMDGISDMRNASHMCRMLAISRSPALSHMCDISNM